MVFRLVCFIEKVFLNIPPPEVRFLGSDESHRANDA